MGFFVIKNINVTADSKLAKRKQSIHMVKEWIKELKYKYLFVFIIYKEAEILQHNEKKVNAATQQSNWACTRTQTNFPIKLWDFGKQSWGWDAEK